MNAVAEPMTHETLEELLRNWARWCRGSIFAGSYKIASIEGQHRADGEEVMEERRNPKDVPPVDYKGLMVERVVIRMPVLERNVLRVEYVFVPRRKYETAEQVLDRRRRRLKMPGWLYEQSLTRGRHMVANLLRRHSAI